MKTLTINSVAVFTALVLVSANVASAKHGGHGGNHGNHSSFNSHSSHSNHGSIGHVIGKVIRASHNYGSYNSGYGGYGGYSESCSSGYGGYSDGYSCSSEYSDAPVYSEAPAYDAPESDGDGEVVVEPARYAGQAYEPTHSNYVVLPGDSFYTISLKEYSTSKNSAFVAQYNSLPEDQALTPGQVIQLPSISAEGELSESSSPVADELQAEQGSQVASVNTKVNSKAPVVEAPRPKVTIGSTLVVDGQPFGQKQGAARLRVGGANLKIEILKWTASSVKIRLPNLDLDSSVKGDIEVLKADGSVATRTPVEVNAAAVVAAR